MGKSGFDHPFINLDDQKNGISCLQSEAFGIIFSMEAPAKTLKPLTIVAAAFNICQSWVAIGATFALSVGHGGNITIIYGLILVAVVYSAIALSIAELAAQYSTAGGQYHWSAILAPPKIRREVVSDSKIKTADDIFLRHDAELPMWVHEYDWLGDMDGQRPHRTDTDHYG